MPPLAATATAWRMARVKAASSVTVWSAGVTIKTGSAPASIACSAASVRAGAVLRPAGSSTRAAGSTRPSRSWSSTRKRCSSLPTTSGACTAMVSSPTPCSRATACWNRLVVPESTRNCLG